MIDLRDYQQSGVGGISGAVRGGARAVLYQAPTGSGKTTVFSYLAAAMAAKGQQVAIVVHRKELLKQASARLAELGVAHGVIAPGHPWIERLVQVASIHTLRRRLDRLHRWGFRPRWLMLDEAHHAVRGNTWGTVLDRFPSARLIGFTATPLRLDGVGLGVHAGGYFDTLIEGPSVRELTARGYLARAELHVPGRLVDASGVPISRATKDYARAELAAATDRPTITGDTIAHYRALGHQLPAIAFCCSVAHAAHVAEAFRAAGYRAASIDGTLSDYERARRLQDLADGGLHVLTSCDLIDEGLDVPVSTVAILLRRTCSKAKHKQQLGRVLRAHPGKRCAIIIDQVGNLLRHGPPDKPEVWSLDGVSSSDSTSDSEEETERALRAAGVRRLPDLVDGRLVAAETDEWGGLRPASRQMAWGLEDLRTVRAVAA